MQTVQFPTAAPTTTYNSVARMMTTEWVLYGDPGIELVMMKVVTGHQPRTIRAYGPTPTHWSSVGNFRREPGVGGIAYVDAWSPMSDTHYHRTPAGKRFSRKALEAAHAEAIEALRTSDSAKLARYYAGDFATA